MAVRIWTQGYPQTNSGKGQSETQNQDHWILTRRTLGEKKESQWENINYTSTVHMKGHQVNCVHTFLTKFSEKNHYHWKKIGKKVLVEHIFIGPNSFVPYL